MAEIPSDVQAAASVNVLDPQGNPQNIPAENVQHAIQLGYKIPSPEEVQGIKDQQEYGSGVNNALKAAGAGAARGLTFGLSDQFLTKTGIARPETLENLKKYQTFSSGLGEIAGVGAGLLAAPEATVVGPAMEALKAAQLTGDGAKIAEAARALQEAKSTLTTMDLANPVSAVNKIGEKVAMGLASPEAAATAQVLAHGANAALQGAAFGAGQSLTEDALGESDLNAQKLMANVGYGALFGGGIGSLLKVGELALPASVKLASDSLGSFKSKLAGEAEEPGFLAKTGAKVSSFVSGKPYEEILDAWKNRALSLTTPEQQLNLQREFEDSLQDQYSKVSKATLDTSTKIRPEESKTLLSSVDPIAAESEIKRVKGVTQETIAKMVQSPELYPPQFIKKLQMLDEALSRNASTGEFSPADMYDALNKFKQNLDPIAKYGKRASLVEQDAVAEFKNLRNVVKNSLEDQSVWGEAGARQSAYNDALNEHLHAKGQFEKTFMKKDVTRTGAVTFKVDPTKVRSFFSKLNNISGEERIDVLNKYLNSSDRVVSEIENSYKSLPSKEFQDKDAVKALIEKNFGVSNDARKQFKFNSTMGHLGGGAHNAYLGESAAIGFGAHNPAVGLGIEAISMLRSPSLAIQRLAQLEKALGNTTRLIGRLSKAVFNIEPINSATLSGFAGSKMIPHSTVTTKISEYSNNPEKLMNHLNKATQSLYDTAPNHATALQSAAARGVQFLNSKVPRQPDPKPLSPKYIPSKGEIAQFNNYYQAVENPLIALKQLKNGTLTPQTIEAISTVVPKLYADMQSQVFNELTDHLAKGKLLPYKTKQSLALFLGQDLDNTMTQSSIMSNQVAFANMGQAQANSHAQTKQKISQTGLSHLNKAERLLTDQQASSQRDRT